MPLHPWTTAVISVTPDGRESPDLDRHNPLGGATLIKGHHLRRRLLVLSNFSGCEFTRFSRLGGSRRSLGSVRRRPACCAGAAASPLFPPRLKPSVGVLPPIRGLVGCCDETWNVGSSMGPPIPERWRSSLRRTFVPLMTQPWRGSTTSGMRFARWESAGTTQTDARFLSSCFILMVIRPGSASTNNRHYPHKCRYVHGLGSRNS